MKTTTSLLIFILISFFSYCQQTTSKNNTYWFDCGLGIANGGKLAGGLSANFSKNNTVYKLRFLGTSEFKLFGQSVSNINYGALYGKQLSNKSVQVSFLGGAGVTVIEKKGDKAIGSSGTGFFSYTKYNIIRNYVFSLPLEIEFYYKPVKRFGLGVSLFADVNTVESSYGVLLKLGFGRYK